MVIDINIMRTEKGGDPEIVLKSEMDRYKGTNHVYKILNLDKEWRILRHRLDTLNRQKNNCSKSFSQKIKSKSDMNGTESSFDSSKDLITMLKEDFEKLSIDQLKVISKDIDIDIQRTGKELSTIETSRDSMLNEVGNILHPSVVISNLEDENSVEKTWGEKLSKKWSHVDLLIMIDGADYKKGTLVAGNRGYFLKGPGMLLAQALTQYSLQKLYRKGYICLYTPFFMKKSIMQEVAQLSQFDDELYKVITSSSDGDEEEKYLIATSEQTIAAYHRQEWMDPDSLPLKYAGLSTCFRQEVGSHGRDTTGIFRVHQFEKVEQFVICSPNDGESWHQMEYMMQNSEELCQELGISYRIVSIVSGALNNAAAKKLDLEAWFPGSQTFRELVSCSNCTDYQSRRLGIRYGRTKQLNKEVQYVHMLNSTMCAVTRVLCCLLETHATETGIVVPECLHPYIPPELKFIPFKTKS